MKTAALRALPLVYQREMRGIPLWLLREYLVELGGKVLGAGRRTPAATPEQPSTVIGPDWLAELEQLEDFCLGSLRVGQVRLSVRAETQAWQQLQPTLEQKLYRAGG